MHKITRRLEFDAGHRLWGHETKCKHLHGHRYKADVTVTAPGLDDLGRVIDFGVVKELVGGFIDRHLDHNLLLSANDPLWRWYSYMNNRVGYIGEEVHLTLGEVFTRKPFILPGPPTAENIANVIYHAAAELLPSPITVLGVKVYETPNCSADFEP